MPAPDIVETRTQQIGRALLETVRAQRGNPFSSRFWSDRLMQWALRDPTFRVQLFRFVDVFPTLRTPAEIHECLAEYLSQPGVELPAAVQAGLKVGALAKGLLAKGVAQQIRTMAGTFIAGPDLPKALPTIRRLWDSGVACSVDLLGEAVVNRVEADAYRQRYLELVRQLPTHMRSWPPQPRLETDALGPLPRANISIKLSALDAQIDAIDFARVVERLVELLHPILDAARQHGTGVTFDMEQHALKDLTLAVFRRCCEKVDFAAGVAMQAYLTSGPADAEELIHWARRTGRQVTVRLIKGAYWDYEAIHAERMNWPVPVWTRKLDTDACFERMAGLLVAAYPHHAGQGGIRLAVGSHNLRSVAHVLALSEACDQSPSAVEVQMLFGMADALQGAVLHRGLRLRQYVPIGPLIPGMAYLVRRLLENASNQSWLRAGFFDDAGDDQLLASPQSSATSTVPAWSAAAAATRHELSPSVAELDGGLPFVNEPFRDFTDRGTREHFAQAIAEVPVPVVQSDATSEQAAEAARRAAAAFSGWRDTPVRRRAEMLVRAAQLFSEQRDQLAGVVIREAGKPWRDADADVCEAIDFCRFYARWGMKMIAPQRLGRFVGEHNSLWHEPRGVAAVISPWNFPMAICMGMTAAALVAGNTVIVKPAEQTPGTARLICAVLWRAGVPREVLQLLPGAGEIVGAALVRDPRVAVIAFTGSKDVGLEIWEVSAQRAAGQPFVKKVVCEMGGKNAIIVDESADLDEAVLGVRQSAFGYAGQKCSACSRAILVGTVARPFLDRFLPATQSLKMGDPRDPATDVGPVIDTPAAAKICAAIEAGKIEARLELACAVPEGLEQRVGKPYVAPHVFSGVQPHHRLAQEEIFGPVLAVMHAASFAEALAIANSTDYRLTGGVFSRRPAHLDLARREFRVGNLYLNRGITGALVGRQPFGGFGLSGTGTQAGGAEYLLHFLQPRSCCENTMRHGFAPG